MAKVGLNNFRYGILTEAQDGTPSYAGAKTPGKAISCNVEVTNNDVKLYADDVVQEADTSFSGGTVTIGIDRDDYETQAELLGHTYNTTDGLIRNSNDVAPYIGFGRVLKLLQDGVQKWKVEFIYKTKLSEPSQEDATQGESVEFRTVEMSGTVAQLANGNWSSAKEFATREEAVAYLESLLGGAPVPVTYTVTYNLNGGTGTIDPDVVNAGDSVTLPDGTGITPPTGMSTFLGWAKTSTSSTATVTSPFTPDADITLYAVYEA